MGGLSDIRPPLNRQARSISIIRGGSEMGRRSEVGSEGGFIAVVRLQLVGVRHSTAVR